VSTVQAASREALGTEFRGQIVEPGDAGYDEARAVFNGMIDRRPAMIARCADVADVISAVKYARANDMLIAVRGGGHNGAGLGTCDGGMVIDLSPMNGVRVMPEAKMVVAQGGCTWGDVDHATHAFGLATPSGIISTTGVGGLTLGGGLGHLTRKCGLSIDNLLGADVVLSDGTFVSASQSENPDLFWAIRGGGGNFGIVTAFVFRLHKVDTVMFGPTLFPLDRAEEIMRWYREFLPNADEDLTGFFAFLKVPPAEPFPEELHMQTMCGVVWCYTGPKETADQAFAPVRALEPALDGVMEVPHPAMQSAFDELFPKGDQWYWRADFVKELSDEAIAEHVKHGSAVPTLQSTMHLYPIDGAASRVNPSHTAWAYRDAKWGMVVVGVDPDPANADLIRDWCVAYHEALQPYSAGGAYVNMMMDEGQERVKASYKDNYARLAEVKAKYDPDNALRVNQNIEPAS
jgi:FAD/FMN-containing dehydrogenase